VRRDTKPVHLMMEDGQMADDLTSRGVNNSAEGKADNLKGKVKDAAGGLTGDSSLQAEGKGDQLKGKAKDTLGKAERNLDRNS
jgi:uncharacterized protein YjbJ (UPF0337 family)